MNDVWFKVDGVLEMRVCEMVYRLEGDQHGAVSIKAKIVMRAYQVLEKHGWAHPG